MAEIFRYRVINFPRSRVWEVLSDYQGIARFNPFLKHSEGIGDGPQCGVGAERRCDMKLGKFVMREKILHWIEDQAYTVEITEHPMPVRSLQTTVGLLPGSDDQVVVFMRSHYQTRFGLLGVLLNGLILKPMMGMMLSGVLRGLETYLGKQVVDKPSDQLRSMVKWRSFGQI